jgi:hypothetical protein
MIDPFCDSLGAAANASTAECEGAIAQQPQVKAVATEGHEDRGAAPGERETGNVRQITKGYNPGAQHVSGWSPSLRSRFGSLVGGSALWGEPAALADRAERRF